MIGFGVTLLNALKQVLFMPDIHTSNSCRISQQISQKRFHDRVWSRHVKCFETSTNMPGIAAVILEIGWWVLGTIRKETFTHCMLKPKIKTETIIRWLTDWLEYDHNRLVIRKLPGIYAIGSRCCRTQRTNGHPMLDNNCCIRNSCHTLKGFSEMSKLNNFLYIHF